ncbi:MAG: thermonuclease family protein [Pseudomonadota bacterium]
MSDFLPVHSGLVLLAAVLVSCTPGESRRATHAVPSETLCRVEQVYDGDSLRVRCEGRAETVRVHCIDAPERDQTPWGDRAHHRVRQVLGGRTVTLHPVERDSYGRLVAAVRVDGLDLGERLVRDGLAVVYTRYCPPDAPHHGAESAARSAQRGVWQTPGLHQTPWRWRHAAGTR